MALPLIGLAVAAVAGGAAGGIFGSIFGGNINSERKRFEAAAKEYQAGVNEAVSQYENASSYAEILNNSSLYQASGNGLDNTFMADLSRAFTSPSRFDFRPAREEVI